MRAIILAAGKGERLRGIVDDIPKPMIKVKGMPILEHNIRWIRSYGITDIYINLHHLPDVIKDYFKGGSRWGVKITYSYEPELVGTAGAVRKILEERFVDACSLYKERKIKLIDNRSRITNNTFLVIYGDNLINYDLREIINFHKRKKGIATIAVYKRNNVSQSGIVILNGENRIIKFIEKPKPREVVSHLANTGLYILELYILNYLSQERVLDFGKDVFPKIIQNGESIFGVIVEGKLTAVDTPKLLMKACFSE